MGEREQGAGFNRRDFLRASGFAVTGSLLAACSRAPVEKAIPYLVQPENTIPGRARWFASTCALCPAACGVLMKVRDGRVVKLEGNPHHPLSQGGLCARGQGQVLELYDTHRLRQPRVNGKPASWQEADRIVLQALAEGRPCRVLARASSSPTERRWLSRFAARFPQVQVVTYEPLPTSAVPAAHRQLFGVAAIPAVQLEKARLLVSFAADFLGTWVAPVALAESWRKARPTAQGRLEHVHVESLLTITGAKADRRLPVPPAAVGPCLQGLVSLLQEKAGLQPLPLPSLSSPLAEAVRELATELWQHRREAVVLCGSQDVAVQRVACAANELVGAYGTVLDLARPWFLGQGEEGACQELLAELEARPETVLVVAGVNPVYELPDGERWAKALSSLAVSVALATHETETTACTKVVLPQAHPLEAWGDAEPSWGLVGFRQPGMGALGEGRAWFEVLASWCGAAAPARQLVAETFQEDLAPLLAEPLAFPEALQRGFALLKRPPLAPRPFRWEEVTPVPPESGAELALVLAPSVVVGAGEGGLNPLLLELPDPITKVSWDNVATLAPETAEKLGVAEGQLVRLTTPSGSVEVPAVVVPGQHPQVVGLSLGWGRAGSERFAGFGPSWVSARRSWGRVGVRASHLAGFREGHRQLAAPVTLAPLPVRRLLARTQDYGFPQVPEPLRPKAFPTRPVVQTTTLAEAGREATREHPRASLWAEDFPPKGLRWGMAIDLDACIGCSACMIACQLENNVPVVGKDEVVRHREMHWLRVDRYFLGQGSTTRAVFQPMLCQQCNHAPCETVCPVLATVHSEDGLNQQVYNRCVGTRYCANNCPYKVRRFNWFSYAAWQAEVAPLLNPDVTVRSRGVMEKCTFCAQRLAEARMQAKEKRVPFTGAGVEPACAQSCPTKAISFGNLLDPFAPVAQAFRQPRAYRVLEELGVDPNVAYLKPILPEAQDV